MGASRRRLSPILWFGGIAAGLFIALSLVFASGGKSRPAVGSVNASQATTVLSLPSRVPDAPVVEPTLLPTWVGRRQPVWGPDGTKTVSFSLDAISDVTASSRTRPQLVTRCLSRATEVYLVTGPLSFEQQAGSHTVRVQVDDEPEQTQQWFDSDGSRELFAPDAVALRDRLAHAHRLRIGFTPFNAKPVTAEFIIEGFDELAPVLARTCARRPSAAR
jgi:hypothetical protein